MIPAPVLPFPGYKWRWLSVAPTESLLSPPVFLGVLRVLARHENQAPSDEQVLQELKVVQEQTGTPVDLVRTPARNLIRNSGQYWKGTGLLLSERGEIRITPLGKKVATGDITQSEFAGIMVQQTVLPNPRTYSTRQVELWRGAGLQIRPLSLILEVMQTAGSRFGGLQAAYMTPRELMRICIPLAGSKAPPTLIAQAIVQNREGDLDVSTWPDCTPDANDHRLAREFLLFLANFGLCRRIEHDNSLDDEFVLDELPDAASVSASPTVSMFADGANTSGIVEPVRHSDLPSMIQRQRGVLTAILRPEQPRFRRQILKAYGGRCFLTGDSIIEILEAAHIVPVNHGGADTPDNGICLRIDVHRLFDSGNIGIKPSGELHLSDAIVSSGNYSYLPHQVQLPPFVNPANVRWRHEYL